MSDPQGPMTASDYSKIGTLRIEKDRLQARLERYEQIGDRMVDNLYGPTAGLLHALWLEARGWDGAPVNEKAHPSSRRHVRGEIS